MTFTISALVLIPAILLRLCRPGPIPKYRKNWFEVSHG